MCGTIHLIIFAATVDIHTGDGSIITQIPSGMSWDTKGICSNYPNGLFHFSCFKIGPWAEYFLVINGCSVECMHSNYPNTQGLPVANKIFN